MCQTSIYELRIQFVKQELLTCSSSALAPLVAVLTGEGEEGSGMGGDGDVDVAVDADPGGVGGILALEDDLAPRLSTWAWRIEAWAVRTWARAVSSS